MPDLTRYQRGQNTSAVRVEMDRVMLDVSRHDPVPQTVTAQHVLIDDAGMLRACLYL